MAALIIRRQKLHFYTLSDNHGGFKKNVKCYGVQTIFDMGPLFLSGIKSQTT